jgi:hypothetical protein
MHVQDSLISVTYTTNYDHEFVYVIAGVTCCYLLFLVDHMSVSGWTACCVDGYAAIAMFRNLALMTALLLVTSLHDTHGYCLVIVIICMLWYTCLLAFLVSYNWLSFDLIVMFKVWTCNWTTRYMIVFQLPISLTGWPMPIRPASSWMWLPHSPQRRPSPSANDTLLLPQKSTHGIIIPDILHTGLYTWPGVLLCQNTLEFVTHLPF